MNCSFEDSTCEVLTSTNLTAYQSTTVINLRISVLSFSLLFGLPTHSYVIWLIVKELENGVASEFFNLNLSICGILFSLYALIYLLKIFSRLQQPVILNLLKFLTGNIITIRPLFYVLRCFEHYLAVVHPVTFLKYKTLRYKLFFSVVVWIMGLASCVFCMFIVATYKLIFMCFALLQFVVFFLVQLFCLVAVLRALKQSGPGERKKETNHIKRRAFNLILTSIMTMFLVFVPFIVIWLLFFSQQQDTLFTLFNLFCFVLGGFIPAFHYLRRAGKLPFFKHA